MNKKSIVNDLVKIADLLDENNLIEEADIVNSVMVKISQNKPNHAMDGGVSEVGDWWTLYDYLWEYKEIIKILKDPDAAKQLSDDFMSNEKFSREEKNYWLGFTRQLRWDSFDENEDDPLWNQLNTKVKENQKIDNYWLFQIIEKAKRINLLKPNSDETLLELNDSIKDKQILEKKLNELIAGLDPGSYDERQHRLSFAPFFTMVRALFDQKMKKNPPQPSRQSIPHVSTKPTEITLKPVQSPPVKNDDDDLTTRDKMDRWVNKASQYYNRWSKADPNKRDTGSIVKMIEDIIVYLENVKKYSSDAAKIEVQNAINKIKKIKLNVSMGSKVDREVKDYKEIAGIAGKRDDPFEEGKRLKDKALENQARLEARQLG